MTWLDAYVVFGIPTIAVGIGALGYWYSGRIR